MKIKNLLLMAVFASAFFSCSSDDEGTTGPLGDYDNGILILNEGGFGNSNASVSYVPQDLSAIEHNIFNATNNTALGDVAQSMGFNNNEAYIVVNNSNKVEVVDRYSFESIATIDAGLESPRFFVVANGKGYITNWGDPAEGSDDYIAVINLENYTVESSIAVSEGPERILEHNGVLYVSHKGGWNSNNVISIIENQNVTEISVNDVPDEMIVDNAGNLWVLSEGYTDWSGGGAGDTAGAISKINTATNTVEAVLEFEVQNHPDLMAYEDGMIYYSVNGEIFKIENSATSLATEPIFSGFFYGMEVNNGNLYLTDAGDFASQGELKVISLQNSTEIASFNTGIVPAKVYFNE